MNDNLKERVAEIIRCELWGEYIKETSIQYAKSEHMANKILNDPEIKELKEYAAMLAKSNIALRTQIVEMKKSRDMK
ncbi:hypothetical protein LCGC14_0359240 [marine sediment metagenome]|uniref:Uncharacterized protein n=1 Tax=marine sediment metagenome TaxID=412755 RepID=A0A0F9TE68_9ZZZZ|nr:hypothetical protein [Candidatus Aminicenantes bacterium]